MVLRRIESDVSSEPRWQELGIVDGRSRAEAWSQAKVSDLVEPADGMVVQIVPARSWRPVVVRVVTPAPEVTVEGL